MSTCMLSFAENVSLFMRLGFILYIIAISANSVYICLAKYELLSHLNMNMI